MVMRAFPGAFFYFSFLFIPAFLAAQESEDIALLNEAHDILYERRTSYILDRDALQASLTEADYKIKQITDIRALLKPQEILVNKFNAEDFFIRYVLEKSGPEKKKDSLKFYLKYAYLSLDKAVMAYKQTEDKQLKEKLKKNQIDLTSMQQFSNYLESELKTNELPHVVRNLAFDEGFPAFPWPPPKASAIDYIPGEYFEKRNSRIYLKDIDRRINEALKESGYYERSYFSVPGGFALVTRLEQINPDASSTLPPDRWSADRGALRDFSLWSYLQALFTANPAYYRTIVFVVTDKPFTHTSAEPDPYLISSGANKLPAELGKIEFTKDFDCTALIYEFKRAHAKDNHVMLSLPSRHVGRVHLEKATIWQSLRK